MSSRNEGPRAVAAVVAAGALALAVSARAAEPWPPATAPKADTLPETPDTVAPRREPEGPPPAPRPPALHTDELARPAPAAAAESLTVRAAPEPLERTPLAGTRDGQAYLRTT